MKAAPETKPQSAALPRALSLKVAKLSAEKGCTYAEALAHVVEKGFKGIERESADSRTRKGLADLSPRQRTVLDGLRDGLAVKEIAHSLEVSEVTVRTHIIRIRQRLDCADLLKLRIP